MCFTTTIYYNSLLLCKWIRCSRICPIKHEVVKSWLEAFISSMTNLSTVITADYTSSIIVSCCVCVCGCCSIRCITCVVEKVFFVWYGKRRTRWRCRVKGCRLNGTMMGMRWSCRYDRHTSSCSRRNHGVKIVVTIVIIIVVVQVVVVNP